MGLLKRIRTNRMLGSDTRLGDEHARFTSYLHAALESPAVIAVLSNYVHQEDQNFRRQEMFAVTDEAFDIAWDAAAEFYEDSPDGDSAAHGYFLALLDNLAPYEKYDYHDLLNDEYRKPLVDRMIDLVRHGGAPVPDQTE